MRYFLYYEQIEDPDRRIIAVPANDIEHANARMKLKLGDEFKLPRWQFKWRDAERGVLLAEVPENAEVLT